MSEVMSSEIDERDYPYKVEHSILLIILDQELYISSKHLNKLSVLTRRVINACRLLSIPLRLHGCKENRIMCFHLAEGYYSPVAALHLIRIIKKELPTEVLKAEKEKIKHYSRYFITQLEKESLVGKLKQIFIPSLRAKKENEHRMTEQFFKEKLAQTIVTFTDNDNVVGKYRFVSHLGGNYRILFVFRKLISEYSNTEYDSIFNFNNVKIDVKYQGILFKYWEERKGTIEQIDENA